MKLVEILAREMEKWPDSGTDVVGQSADGSLHLNASTAKNRGFTEKVYELAEDWCSQDVTRADWKAEREKLKAPKANGDREGWQRARGRKPNYEELPARKMQVRHRDKSITDGWTTHSWNWGYGDGAPDADIMAFRIENVAGRTSEQPDEHDLTRAPKPEAERKCEGRNCKMPDAENHSKECLLDAAIDQGWAGPIEWRDRIRELDTQRAEVESTYRRQISEITQERESLVQRLAGEGLALVEAVVQPVEDMSDWAKWREGDIIKFIKTDGDTPSFTLGKHYVVADVNMRSYNPVSVKEDDDGDYNGWKGEYFKFVSRPAT